jgi:hypothetical protein
MPYGADAEASRREASIGTGPGVAPIVTALEQGPALILRGELGAEVDMASRHP